MIHLGGLTAQQFLRRYWQKKPRLITRASPRLENFIDRGRAIALACSRQVESRLVLRRRGHWRAEHGPFKKSDFKTLPEKNWTLLIQGVNLHLAEADHLLREFSFIPYSRLDDLMVSYAVAGGGVGPHYDSYDVFLLQGMGRRRWQIGRCRDATLIPNAPLKLLKNFAPDWQHVLETGDMLYLPPHFAHHGIALDECVTYSIGFRAPAAHELAVQFLAYLEDELAANGEYHDSRLKTQRQPALISDSAIAEAARLLKRIKWNGRDIENFFGRYLSEPKPQVFFIRPRRPMTRQHFLARCRKFGVMLDLKTQMLYRDRTIFINGERARGDRVLFELANRRCLPAGPRLDRQTSDLLYSWYLAGYVSANDEPKKLEQHR
jgi:50S ribosomal protein L16 3-hydroxylase